MKLKLKSSRNTRSDEYLVANKMEMNGITPNRTPQRKFFKSAHADQENPNQEERDALEGPYFKSAYKAKDRNLEDIKRVIVRKKQYQNLIHKELERLEELESEYLVGNFEPERHQIAEQQSHLSEQNCEESHHSQSEQLTPNLSLNQKTQESVFQNESNYHAIESQTQNAVSKISQKEQPLQESTPSASYQNNFKSLASFNSLLSVDDAEHEQFVRKYQKLVEWLKSKKFKEDFWPELQSNRDYCKSYRDLKSKNNDHLKACLVREIKRLYQVQRAREEELYGINSIYVQNMIKNFALKKFIHTFKCKEVLFKKTKVHFLIESSHKSAFLKRFQLRHRKSQKIHALNRLFKVNKTLKFLSSLKEYFQKSQGYKSKQQIVTSITTHKYLNIFVKSTKKVIFKKWAVECLSFGIFSLRQSILPDLPDLCAENVNIRAYEMLQEVNLQLLKLKQPLQQHSLTEDMEMCEEIYDFYDDLMTEIKRYLLTNSLLNVNRKKRTFSQFKSFYSSKQRPSNDINISERVDQLMMFRKNWALNQIIDHANTFLIEKKTVKCCNIIYGQIPSFLQSFDDNSKKQAPQLFCKRSEMVIVNKMMIKWFFEQALAAVQSRRQKKMKSEVYSFVCSERLKKKIFQILKKGGHLQSQSREQESAVVQDQHSVKEKELSTQNAEIQTDSNLDQIEKADQAQNKVESKLNSVLDVNPGKNMDIQSECLKVTVNEKGEEESSVILQQNIIIERTGEVVQVHQEGSSQYSETEQELKSHLQSVKESNIKVQSSEEVNAILNDIDQPEFEDNKSECNGVENDFRSKELDQEGELKQRVESDGELSKYFAKQEQGQRQQYNDQQNHRSFRNDSISASEKLINQWQGQKQSLSAVKQQYLNPVSERNESDSKDGFKLLSIEQNPLQIQFKQEDSARKQQNSGKSEIEELVKDDSGSEYEIRGSHQGQEEDPLEWLQNKIHDYEKKHIDSQDEELSQSNDSNSRQKQLFMTSQDSQKAFKEEVVMNKKLWQQDSESMVSELQAPKGTVTPAVQSDSNNDYQVQSSEEQINDSQKEPTDSLLRHQDQKTSQYRLDSNLDDHPYSSSFVNSEEDASLVQPQNNNNQSGEDSSSASSEQSCSKVYRYLENHRSYFVKKLVFNRVFRERAYKETEKKEKMVLERVFQGWCKYYRQKHLLRKYLKSYESMHSRLKSRALKFYPENQQDQNDFQKLIS